MTAKNVSITGAAGNIAYSLVFKFLSKLPFFNTEKINLRLLDITPFLKTPKWIKI